jgi:hypothetical protein
MQNETAGINNACPECQSEDWKLAKVVFAEGNYHVDEEHEGSAIGIGAGTGGLGIGYGRTGGTTTGRHQSEAALRAARPERPDRPKPLRQKPELITEEQHRTSSLVIRAVLALISLYVTFSIKWYFGVLMLIALAALQNSKRIFSEVEKYDPNKDLARRIREWDVEAEAHSKIVASYEDALWRYENWPTMRVCERCGHSYWQSKAEENPQPNSPVIELRQTPSDKPNGPTIP